jgi:DNA-binding MarR family transcriptional regulator
MPTQKYKRLGPLDELHAASIILMINERGEAVSTDFKEIGAYYGMVALADLLASEGIVEREATTHPRSKVTYRLTHKGKKIAKKLEEIEDILDE